MAPLSIVDSTYKVAMDARPSNYLVTHVSWERPKTNLNWYRYVLVRSPFGYPLTPDDGELIFPNASGISATGASRKSIGFSDDVILKVNSISTGGVISSLTVVDIGAANGIAVTDVSPVSTDALKGKNAVISISSGGTVTVVNGGGNYAVGDMLRIPGNSVVSPTSTTTLPGITVNEQLGVTNTFHLYDNGAATATTANPVASTGYGDKGTNPYNKNYSKYYYSLFAYVAPTNYTGSVTLSDVIAANGDTHYTFFNWIKIGEVSSVVVYENEYKSTKDVLLEHLPNFYTGLNTSAYNQDLADFMSLLAFHIDTYAAKIKAVYNMSDISNIDESLLKAFLKQYGSELRKISDITQARVVLENIIRNYSLSGTTLGLKNLIESYTGNPVKQIAPLNILSDYNTSSFVEGIGNWYPDPNTPGSYDPAYPYNYTNNPLYAALNATTGTYQTGDVAQILDPSLGTVNTSPLGVFTGKLAYIREGSGSVTNNYETTLTTVSGTSTTLTITTGDTSKIRLGSIPLVISGTGVFATSTVVTSVGSDGKTFTVNVAPATALSNATVAFSNNITSGALALRPSSTTADIKFYNGVRRGLTVSTTNVDTDKTKTTQVISLVKPNIIKVGDYVSGHPSIPAGTRVLSFNTGIRISTKLTSTLPSGTLLYFSSQQSRDVGVAVDMTPVEPLTPYTFLVHSNANNATTKSIVTALTWYDSDGNLISTSSVTTSAVTGSAPLSNATDFAKTWYPAYVTAKSPSNAAYVEPSFSVLNASQTSRYLIDGAALFRPVNVIGISRVSNIATLTTDVAHNFYYDTTGTTTTPVAVTIPSDSTFDTDGSVITSVNQTKLGNYTFSYTSPGTNTTISAATGNGTTITFTVPNSGFLVLGDKISITGLTGAFAEVVSGVITDIPNSTSFTISSTASGSVSGLTNVYYTIYRSGFASSVPMIKAVIGSNHYFLTGFQDARNTTLEVVANRTNLVRNPSFEYDTATPTAPFGWTAQTSCTLSSASSVSASYIGTRYLQVSKGTTGTALTAGVDSEEIKVNPSDLFYTASCYVRNIGTTASNSVRLGIKFKIGTTYTATLYSSAVTLSSNWKRVELSVLIPENASAAVINISSLGASTSSIIFGVDAVLFEKSEHLESAQVYFDGDFDGYNYSLTRDSMWESTPGQSTSHLYTNRVVNKLNIDSLALRSINYA